MAITYGLYLSNRAVVLGSASVGELLELAEWADRETVLDSVWVGDALLVNPRLEALALLNAVAARTRRVLLGVGCMGSFPLREPLAFATEWASLDVISGGRALLAACVGGGRPGASTHETQSVGIAAGRRRQRMFALIDALRALWSKDDVSAHNEFFSFADVTIAPKPVQQPCPIWLATNAGRSMGSSADARIGKPSDRILGQVAEYADGWLTHSLGPEAFRIAWERVRELAAQRGREISGNTLYCNFNINDDTQLAYAQAKASLDEYYATDFPRERVDAWTIYGSVGYCAERLSAFAGTGVQRIVLRACGARPKAQYATLLGEVLPHVDA